MPTIKRATLWAIIASALVLPAGCVVGLEDEDAELTDLEKNVPRDGFISVCEPSHGSKDDPIVFPRLPGASHRHTFYGNETTDAFSTDANMRPADTACDFEGDTAGYWMPTAFKSGDMVEPMSARMYYRRGRLQGHIDAYPYGLRMVAGDGQAKSPQSLDIVKWGCAKNEGTKFSTPQECGDDHVNAKVVFPNCWDGVRLDSPDHKSHMAYDVDGVCPKTHPRQMPHLFLDFQFTTSHGKGIRLSSDPPGAPGGLTLHADFWNTWDETKLEQKVTKCFNTDQACDEL